MSSAPPLLLSLRSSLGCQMLQEQPYAPGEAEPVDRFVGVPEDVFPPEPCKTVKCLAFHPSGLQLAWSTGSCVRVAKRDRASQTWRITAELPRSRVTFLQYSPLGSVLAGWEVFGVKAGQAPEPNLHLWSTEGAGSVVGAFVQKKAKGWCPQWTKDESLCCLRSVNNEVHFYRDNDFSQVNKKLSLAKMDSFSLTPHSTSSQHIVCFVPGQKGGPGFGKLYTYPNFHPEKDLVANKSFFQSDALDTHWNSDGKSVLLVTQADVDKTGASYYGKQQLHYMSSRGDTSMVQLAKDGPIYSVTWSPTDATVFAVVYGFMPAKATLYNHKCEKLFDYGTGPRNLAEFNPQGNLLMLGGFGNLRGVIEIWSVKDKKKVSDIQAPDSTDVRWSPHGKYLMTSTCAPRLRTNNGFKVWHYTSSLLHEQPLSANNADELWEVTWSRSKECTPFQISYTPVRGIQPSVPKASKQAYRPPGMRGKPGLNTKLHDEDELPENVLRTIAGYGKEKEAPASLSKTALKNKKRREAAAKKREEEQQAGGAAVAPPAAAAAENGSAAATVNGTDQKGAFQTTGDPDKDKKLRKLNDKLFQIQKLKQQQKEGKQLEINQLEKLKKEHEIVDEINKLKL